MLILYSHSQINAFTAIDMARGYIMIERNTDLALFDVKKYNKPANNIPRALPTKTKIADNSKEWIKEFLNSNELATVINVFNPTSVGLGFKRDQFINDIAAFHKTRYNNIAENIAVGRTKITVPLFIIIIFIF